MADSLNTLDTEASANTAARDQTVDDALLVSGLARGVFDATGGQVIATVPFGPTLPDNAVILRAWYHVITTFTSATDAGTISLGVATDDPGGSTVAVAISDVGNPWDETAPGFFDCIQDGAAANVSIQTTGARRLVAIVGAENLTAGELIMYAEYVVTE